ncbi:MAG: TAXI family TRAP transporter solute-binding subunit [Lachnospiraceae bacterium]|nr:TAXI family TRAP transporter solute-binding subunit [Lachnospiraceae bacterium]
MKKRLVSLILVLAMTAALLAGCGGGGNTPSTTKSTAKVEDVELLAGSSTVQNVGIAVADVVTKNCATVRMAATGTNSTEANIVQMMQKSDRSHTFYMASAAPFLSAKYGVAAFKEYQPTADQRLVAAMMYGTNGFVTTNPDIKSVADLNGKKVAMFADQMPQQMAQAAFEILGIKAEIVTMTFSDQFTALGDGLVDACLYLGTGLPNGTPLVPVGPLQELVANKGGKVYAVTFPADLQNQAVEKAGFQDVWPYSPITVPVGSLSDTYKEEFDAYGSVTGMICAWADTDEELVYQVTKTICENYASLGDYMTELKQITPDLMLSMLYMAENEQDIHPGALRYYKEKGLWPDVWEKANKK